MTTKFHTLRPDMSIADAVKAFRKASENEERKVFGIMVTDKKSRLIGMLSMYDILLYLRPKHIHIWGTMDDIEIEGLMDQACERLKSIQVADIMTQDVITVTPDAHLMFILDLMIKKHIRRVPVVEGEKIRGIVYISTLFYHLLDRVKS
jgi:CBS domain-containing protein